MPVQYRNFDFSYQNARGKWVYVPSDEGRRRGAKLQSLVRRLYSFPSIYRHFQANGHVGALHAHRQHSVFAHCDLKDFFYSVRRNRVTRALREIGVEAADSFARWSTVRDPRGEKGYVLPYGFVQSPILASLVMAKSNIGDFLSSPTEGITVSVFLDDICVSSDDQGALRAFFNCLTHELSNSDFQLHEQKTQEPASRVEVFNCDLTAGSSEVTQARVELFYSIERNELSVAGFEAYRDSVACGNSSAP